jgi:hypothetical protein
MHWIVEGTCYQGATENKYILAAEVPDGRQCAGVPLRNHGLIVGTCAEAGFPQSAGPITINTCHLGPTPFAVWKKQPTQMIILMIWVNLKVLYFLYRIMKII